MSNRVDGQVAHLETACPTETTRPEPERGGAAETLSAQPDDAPGQGPTVDRAGQLRERQEQSRAANIEGKPGETGNLVDVTGV